jgi:GNAT superfamily N-acetyltransferase
VFSAMSADRRQLQQRVTYLQMMAPGWRQGLPPPVSPPDPAARIARLDPVEDAFYLALFQAIGAPWLWFERLRLPAAERQALFADPGYEVRVLFRDDKACGLAELDRRTPREVEIVYLGVTPEIIGHGFGRFLFADTLAAAWAGAPGRVWLHTCSFDHPGAIAFYRAAGFAPYREEEIWIDDPRLTGVLPRGCAPQIPLADPDAGT